MNIVKSGNSYQVYGNEIITYDKLPAGTYNVCFQKMMGFFLEQRTDLEIKEEKIYGPYYKKVDKVLNSFAATNRNFGVILSGKKGVGKTLFTRVLAEKALELDYPMLVCSGYTPGIENFLSSIEQEVIVLFDEFEKTFAEVDGFNPQETMLSLFDGIDNGKKLFIITCNEVNKLNNYYLNRPGRFHYHFKMRPPTVNEIEEYLNDKILSQYKNVIPNIVAASFYGDITYDCLRAIAAEVNMGYSIEDTFEDLNITTNDRNEYEYTIICKNGTVFKGIKNIDFTDNKDIYLDSKKTFLNNETFYFAPYFNPKSCCVNLEEKIMTIDPSKVGWYVDVDYSDLKHSEAKEFIEENYIIDRVEFRPCNTSLENSYYQVIRGAV